jgi:CRISPR/Cas system CMR subunit Cmr6 (Cas7 group RAMP superfamily)
MKTVENARHSLARRQCWLAPWEHAGCVRHIRIQALTDVIVNLVSPSPLELALALHTHYGFPILPASGLKGLARSVHDKDFVAYGDEQQEAVGTVAILDGWPIKFQVSLDMMTPHYPKWYGGESGSLPDDTESPVPIPFLSIRSGALFEVTLIARDARRAQEDLGVVTNDLCLGLRERGLGAKTAAGYGVFEIVETDSSGHLPSSTPRIPIQPQRTPFEERLAQIEAIPAHKAAGSIGPHLIWCLDEIKDPGEKRQAAEAITKKMTVGDVKDNAKRKKGRWPELWDIVKPAAAE